MKEYNCEAYVTVSQKQQPGKIERRQMALGALEPNSVLIRVRAVSLNYRDLLIIDDEGRSYGEPSIIPVSDGAGEVEAIGSAVTSVKVGERVMPSFFLNWIDGAYRESYRDSALAGSRHGLLATYAVVPEHSLVRIPEIFSFEEASCFPCAAVTAWNALIKAGRLSVGEKVLIQGTGGVSVFALQICKMFGAQTIVLSGSDQKIAKAKQLGADYCINYKSEPDWSRKVLEITNGVGVDHLVEVVGNQNLARSIECLAPHGRIAYIGCLGGFEGGFDPLSLLYKNASLNAIYVGSRSDLVETCTAFANSKVRPAVDSVLPFTSAPEAFDYLRSGSHFGKVVITVA